MALKNIISKIWNLQNNGGTRYSIGFALTPTVTPTATLTQTPTVTATASITATPTVTPTATVSSTDTRTPTPTVSATRSNTPTATPTPTPASGLQISTASLTTATVGIAYTAGLTATGGTGPYKWQLLTAAPNTGLWAQIPGGSNIVGTPQVAEISSLTVQVTDALGATVSKIFSLTSVASGSLSIVSSTTLPAATSTAPYNYQLIAQGGAPPYKWSSTASQPWHVTSNGMVCGAPQNTTSGSFSVTVTDITGATATASITVPVNASSGAIVLGGKDSVSGLINLPPAIVNHNYQARLNSYAGSGSYTYSASGLPSWAILNTSTGIIAGKPTGSGAISFSVSVTDGTHTNSATAWIGIANDSSTTRPSYNGVIANGMFVKNGILYDKNGLEFRVRGTNRNHYDSASWANNSNGALAGHNCSRIFMYKTDGTITTATYVNVASTQCIANGIVPIMTMSLFPNGNQTTGNTSTTDFSGGVTWWVNNVSSFSPIMDRMMINIANEWGPSNSTTWRDQYISAVSSLRTAGYTCPLVIDCGGSGQNSNEILSYASAIQSADTLQNCVFSYHAYGSVTNLCAKITGITKANPAVITIAGNGSTHPFCPGYPGNSFTGFAQYYITGVNGMTQINGTVTATHNNVGGSSGAWTITLSGVDSTTFGTYTSGGTIVPYDQSSSVGDYYRFIADLGSLKGSGICCIVGEFGPGENIGPSPTTVSIGEIISACEATQVGYNYWAWDDNNATGAQTTFAGWFGMTGLQGSSYTTGQYTLHDVSGLTAPGLDLILNPRYGLYALPNQADVFLSQLPTSRLGINLDANGGAVLDSSGFPLFQNRVTEARGFTQISNPANSVTLDANGWPVGDFLCLLAESANSQSWQAGTYKCGYTGTTGTPTGYGAPVQNVSTAGGNTTFDLVVASGTTNYGFQVTGTGGATTTGLFAYLPAYPTGSAEFTTEALNHHGKYSHIRFMDFTNVLFDTTTMTSSNRNTKGNFKTNKAAATSNTADGYPMALAVDFANASKIGLWGNAAMNYDSTYLASLATDMLAVNPGYPIYIEPGNEVWNFVGIGGSYTAKVNAYKSAHPGVLDYDSTTDQETLNARYLAVWIHDIGTAFSTVFGSRYGTDLKVVAAWQTGSNGLFVFYNMLQFLIHQYGDYKPYVHALAIAPYMTRDNTHVPSDGTNHVGVNDTIANIQSQLTNNATWLPYFYNCENISILASHYGLQFLSYEGGQEVAGEASVTNMGAAIMDTGMTSVVSTYLNNVYDLGGFDAFTWLASGVNSGSGTLVPGYNLSNNYANLISTGSPRLAGFNNLFNGTINYTRNVVGASGATFSAQNCADFCYNGSTYLYNGTNPTLAGQATLFAPFLGTTGYVPYKVNCTAPGNYIVKLQTTGTGGTTDLWCNGTKVATGVTIASGIQTTTVGTVTLKKGRNALVFGNGTYQPSVTLTTIGPFT